MNNVDLHQGIRDTIQAQSRLRGPRGPRFVALAVLLVSGGLLIGRAGATESARPCRIGVLMASWEPTPSTVGLHNGLLALG